MSWVIFPEQYRKSVLLICCIVWLRPKIFFSGLSADNRNKRTIPVTNIAELEEFSKGPFWGAYFWRGLSTERNLRFKIDWASLTVVRKFTVFALFYFVFEGNFQVQARREAYIWRVNGGFLRCEFGRLVFGAAYIWRGLFSEFYGTCTYFKCCL